MFRQETNNVHVSKDNEVNLNYLRYLTNCYLGTAGYPNNLSVELSGKTKRPHEPKHQIL